MQSNYPSSQPPARRSAATAHLEQATGINHFPTYRWSASLLVLLAATMVHVLFGLGFAWPWVPIMMAAGVFMYIEPKAKPLTARDQRSLPRAQDSVARQPQRTLQSSTTRLNNSHLLNGIADLRDYLIPVLKDPHVRDSSYKLVKDIEWVAKVYDALVDYPQHQATMRNVTCLHVPQTLEHFRHLENSAGEAAKKPTLQSLEILNNEVLRIKAAILENRLHQLEGHAEALKRQFPG